MLRFLFWNIGRSTRVNLLRSLLRESQSDIVILAENEVSAGALLEAMNETGPNYFLTNGLCEKITILTRFPGQFIEPISEGSRYSIRAVSLPARQQFLLVAVHQPDKSHVSDAGQILATASLGDRIRGAEQLIGHTNTILVGDLNMNPFEPGVVGAKGLNSVATRQRALKLSRTVDGEEYPFFFNPMWTLYGDGTAGPPGTYHYRDSEQVVHYWNMFDQVLIRPSLIDRYHPESLHIVDNIDGETLVDRLTWIPNARVASDHLPIEFSLDL